RRDLEHSSLKHLAWISIHADLCRVANFDVRQLCLAEIRGYPADVFDKWHNLRAGRDELSGTDLPLSHGAVRRRENLRVTQIHSCDLESSFSGMEVGYKLALL